MHQKLGVARLIKIGCGSLKMAETRKRKTQKKDEHRTAEERRKQPTKERRSGTIIIMLVVLGISLAVVVYGFIPGRYTGPKFRHSEKAAEKEMASKVEQTPSVPQEYANTTCDELTDQAKAIIARAKTRGEEVEIALDLLATCILQEDSAAARWNLAAALLQLNRVDEAFPFIDEALTLDPDNSLYLHDAGLLFARLELYREAVLCLEKYLEASLRIVKWESLLAELSILRNDDWQFLYEADDLLLVLEHLLNSYLQESSLLKAGYLYRICIGLRGPDNVPELVKAYALYSFSVGDVSTGIDYLQLQMEQLYIDSGYGDRGRARDIVVTHSLRLLTHGINGLILGIVRNLLRSGQSALSELTYHCELTDEVQNIDLATPISQALVRAILVRCMTIQNIIPQLLQNGAIVHAENVFGWTPLLQVIPLNSTEILHQVLTGKADVQSKTGMGLTALHVAAIAGSTAVVEMLVQAGLKQSSLDSFNRSALDVACYQHWPSTMMARCLKTQLPTGCPPPPLYLPPSKGFKSGGWLPSAITLPLLLTVERCDIDIIGYTASSDELLLDYLSLQRPVVIRNATNRQSLRNLFRHWQRDSIVEKYGDLTFREVLVPYARAFGTNDTVVTLRSFIERLKQQKHQVSDVLDMAPPTYIFESIPESSPILEHFKIPSVLNPTLTDIVTREIQFYVGGALSGAPPHYHSSAWNVLVYGLKRWFIYPPHESFYSKQHVWDWWRSGNRPQALECVQHPGDLVLLPDMWGHAVINLRESVGVASEFIYGSSEFSL